MANSVVMRSERKAFDRLKSGKTLWEVRLNDEKRKCVGVGDEIVFMRRPELEDRLPMIVEEKVPFTNVQRLLDNIDLVEIGDYANELEFIQQLMTHYTPGEMMEKGLLAFKVRKA